MSDAEPVIELDPPTFRSVRAGTVVAPLPDDDPHARRFLIKEAGSVRWMLFETEATHPGAPGRRPVWPPVASADAGESEKGPPMPERLRDLTEPELTPLMRRAARAAESELPAGTLFILLAFDPPDEAEPAGGIAQYISNARRDGIVETLREAADRLEGRDEVERVPFLSPPGPGAGRGGP